MKKLSLLGAVAVLSVLIAGLVGCGVSVSGPAVSTSPVVVATGAGGTVYGGSQAISNASIQLWTVGTTANASGAVGLLPTGSYTAAGVAGCVASATQVCYPTSVTTSSSGGYSLGGQFSCANAPNQLVYLTATGGNPGLAAGTNNTAIQLMTAIGPCSNLVAGSKWQLNEATTVASVYSLMAYMGSTGSVGSTAANAANLTAAFAMVNNLVNTSTGYPQLVVANGTELAPQSELDTLANILATCVNSTGSTASGQPCASLFAAATGSIASSNVLQAALNIANNPSDNIFSLASTNGPFQPTLSSTPSSWTVTLTPVVTVTTSSLATATVGTSYSQQLAASGGSGSGYTWTVTSGTGLSAPGLSLSSGGAISGIPLGVQTATPVTVKVTDSSGNTATAALTLTVGSPATTVFIPLASFTGGGAEQVSSLVQGLDGNYYATTSGGGSFNYGTIIKITPSGTVTQLYRFCSLANCADGTSPGADGYAPNNPASLVMGPDGNFYGTTSNFGNSAYASGSGGDACGPGNSISGCGTVFKITPSGQLTTLYDFCSLPGCADGGLPKAGLVPGSDGNFYGTTLNGGTNPNSRGDGGTIFKITPTGQLTTLYSFCSVQNNNGGCLDGDYANQPLVQGSDGSFYGTTLFGGSSTSFGEVFQLTSANRLNILYAFPALEPYSLSLNGASPQGKLVEGSDGRFYGTQSGQNGAAVSSCTGTNAASYWGCGSIFAISTAGTFTNLYYFGINEATGIGSLAGLALGSDGNFYGTSEYGGNFSVPCTDSGGCGTLSEMTTGSGGTTVTPLYALCALTSCADGHGQDTALLQASNGNFVGTTSSGGTSGGGEFFELAPATPLAPPVQLSLSSATVTHGSPVTVNWQVLNAFSTTMQVCNAFATTAGTNTPLGKQAGTLTSGIYAGSFGYTPAAAGSYSLALNCGGTETGFATLTAQ